MNALRKSTDLDHVFPCSVPILEKKIFEMMLSLRVSLLFF
jgi:hypothetical protein